MTRISTNLLTARVKQNSKYLDANVKKIKLGECLKFFQPTHDYIHEQVVVR